MEKVLSHTTPPWRDLSHFPEKPPGATTGYLAPREKDFEPEFEPATFGEIAELVRDGGEDLLVATPEHANLVPPSSVPELWSAIDENEHRRRKDERKEALISCLIFGAIVAYGVVRSNAIELFAVFLLAVFGIIPLLQNLIGTVRRRLRGDRTAHHQETAARTLFSFWLGTRSISATRALVGTLVALFVIQVLAFFTSFADLSNAILAVPQASVDATALDRTAVRGGDWWRLLTCAFVHGNLIHIAFNGTAAYNIGSVLEPLYGRAAVLGTFLLSALGGSLASFLLSDGPPSVGASGGVLGLIGFLLVVAVRHRKLLPPDLAKSIVRAVLFIAALGVAAWQLIDNAAHAGGFLTGVLLALPTTRDPASLGNPTQRLPTTTITYTSAAILTATALTTAYRILTTSPGS